VLFLSKKVAVSNSAYYAKANRFKRIRLKLNRLVAAVISALIAYIKVREKLIYID
jgi:hypothetical protein